MTYPLMSSRDICDEFSISPETLQAYETQNLIHPIRDGARRYYSAGQIARLKVIVRAKEFGFSAERINEVISLLQGAHHDPDQIDKTLVIARRQLTELTEIQNLLSKSIANLDTEIAGLSKLAAQNVPAT